MSTFVIFNRQSAYFAYFSPFTFMLTECLISSLIFYCEHDIYTYFLPAHIVLLKVYPMFLCLLISIYALNFDFPKILFYFKLL